MILLVKLSDIICPFVFCPQSTLCGVKRYNDSSEVGLIEKTWATTKVSHEVSFDYASQLRVVYSIKNENDLKFSIIKPDSMQSAAET